jgi:hypothetical protein
MDAIAFENDHYGYVIQNVEYAENSMAAEDDELSIFVDPTSGAVRFDYVPKSRGNLQYERFWDNATAWVSGRFGVVFGESMTANGMRYFSIALDRKPAQKGARTIHVYVSRTNAAEAPAPEDGTFTGGK